MGHRDLVVLNKEGWRKTLVETLKNLEDPQGDCATIPLLTVIEGMIDLRHVELKDDILALKKRSLTDSELHFLAYLEEALQIERRPGFRFTAIFSEKYCGNKVSITLYTDSQKKPVKVAHLRWHEEDPWKILERFFHRWVLRGNFSAVEDPGLLAVLERMRHERRIRRRYRKGCYYFLRSPSPEYFIVDRKVHGILTMDYHDLEETS